MPPEIVTGRALQHVLDRSSDHRESELQVLATAARPDGELDPDSARVAAAYGVDLAAVLAQEQARGRPGEVVRVPAVAPPGLPPRWLLVGVGDATAHDLRRSGAALGRTVRGRRALATTLATRLGPSGASPQDGVRALVEGLVLGGYAPPATGTTPREDRAAVERIELLGRTQADAVRLGELHALATVTARDLAATPSSVKSPAWMVDQARAAAGAAGLGIQVWDGERLAAEGFGGLVAVGAGSADQPYLVRLDYHPDDQPDGVAQRHPVVLVGKGITFDTGGISLKPREAMIPMKTDMSGAAAVLAVLTACRRTGVRQPVTGLLPLAENAIGAASYRPGDVVRIFGGRTVEVGNTDAEGRMVLADALTYADTRLDPEVLIDVATLTGAATVGLGRRHAALYTSDSALAAALQAAAAASGERVWRMPLVEDYLPALESSIADLRQVPLDGKVGGGSITAALFLRSFTGSRRWAHLDIAGVARADKDEHEVAKGATGYGARLLLRWLERLR